MNKRKTGYEYETAAVEYLKRKGYMILDRNFSCRTGEIDVIARDKEVLVFIEVKYRSQEQKGRPEEAVDFRKRNKIRNAARYYMMKESIPEDMPCRFDVIGIIRENIYLLKDAFDGAE